jgi:hypothetical protein
LLDGLFKIEKEKDNPLQGITQEIFRLLSGSPTSAETKKTWAEWGPRFAEESGRPLWLFPIEHPNPSHGSSCSAPFPPQAAFACTFASEGPGQSAGMLVDPLPSLWCSNCWVEVMRMPGSTFLIMPDGKIINPHGARLVKLAED